ncbi:hypothetical protein GC197_16390 [bacterium]|nr:hypothetical protein [bacterium]
MLRTCFPVAVTLLFLLSAVGCAPSSLPADEPTTASQEIFNKRLLPIFQSSKPSSCTECHLSGVELKDYILPTESATFASLVKAGMVDMKTPANSKILQFIQRTPEKSPLVRKEVREQEYEAFRAWIEAAAKDPQMAKAAARPIGPQLPDEVIRHARKDRVLASFVDNIWTEVGRCAACHSPDRNQKQVKEHGESVSWITLNDPEATLGYMLEADLIDPDKPEESLLLQKPTLQVKHGGGQKMVVGDRSYKQFRRFLDDYAAMTHSRYQSPDDLPKQNEEVSLVTDIWLKIVDVPKQYDQKLLQVDLYRQTDGGWSEYRVATADRLVFGKQNLWQETLSLIAPRESKWAEQISKKQLPPGKYQARIYIDQSGKLQKDYQQTLGPEDFIGTVDFESRWQPGYGKMTKIVFPKP